MADTLQSALNPRREAICLGLAAAEMCWVLPVLMSVGRLGSSHPALLTWAGILVAFLAFFYIYRSLEAAALPQRLQQALLALSLLLAIGLFLRFHVYSTLDSGPFGWLAALFGGLAREDTVDPGGWVAVMLLVYLWARGVHLARRSLSVESVGFSFRAGVVIVTLEAFFFGLALGSDLSSLVVPYFFFSLVAVALARVDEVSRQPNSSRVGYSGFWLGSALGSVAVLVLLATVVAAFFYGGGLTQLLRWLWPVLSLLSILIAAIGAFFLLLVEALLSLFSIDLGLIGQGLLDVLRRVGEFLAIPPGLPPPGSNPAERPPILGVLQVAITLGIPLAVVAIGLLVTRIRRRLAKQGEGDESRESTFSARSAASVLRAGLERLSALAGLVDRVGLGSRFAALVSIRRIYANLVRLATSAGYPRARSETPYEYLSTLNRALPGSEAEVKIITEAYVNAHYGRVPDSRQELDRIRACWERVRAAGKEKQR